MKNKARIFGLDLMRATAILLVIFAHYFASTPLEMGGLPGVEIFFVLSGFLIGDILIRSLQEDGVTVSTLGTFWVKRWFRTLPNYVFFLSCHLLYAVVLFSQLPDRWYLYPFFLQNFFNPNPGFFAESWSLAVEEWFYLLFPMLACLFNGAAKLNHRALLAAVLFFLIVPLILRCFVCSFWSLQTIRMIVPLRLDTMMYGVIAAMIMNWCPTVWARWTALSTLISGLILFAIGLYLVHLDAAWCAVVCFPVLALGAALALPYLNNLPQKSDLLCAPIVYISKVSYSTYLFHMPFFFFVDGFIAWGHTPTVIKLACRLLMIVAALLLSYLPYRYIEQPFLGLRQVFLKKANWSGGLQRDTLKT
jgi:peptidoglycan/LPS O-acetylase OafA/YrhL